MMRIIIGIFILVLGLSALTGLSLMEYAVSLFLIAAGLVLISGRTQNNWEPAKKVVTNEDQIHEVVIFGPLNKTVKSDNFKGGKITAVFGGGEVDLSQVKTTEKNINLEFVAVFGGGKLIIPKGWKVNSQGVAIFGGYTSKVAAGEGETVLNIKGAAVFGGVEILN